MGQHYVPREYLGHFATPADPKKIWMYDKADDKFRVLPIAAVAQSPDFYLPQDEASSAQKWRAPRSPH